MQLLNRHGWSPGRSFAFLIAAALAVSVLALPSAAQQKQQGKEAKDLIGSGAAAADPGPVIFSNGTTITIPTGGAATPYPSSLAYNWCPGTITDVNVFLTGFNHTWPDDVDVVLQGPAGQSTFIMSDVGGSADAVNLSFTVDDEAASPFPDAGPLVSGTFRPTNIGGADGMPGPSPNPATASLSVFDGTSPVGNWNLFVQDDDGIADSGNFQFGWGLALEVTSQASGTRVCIPHFGAGEPYPSAQTVSFRSNPVQDVNVTLSGLSHTWPDDLDILLVGPGGQNAMLMSDAGGSLDVNNVNLKFDDEAPASLPDSAQITSGSFKPTNFDTLENLPAPAPATQGTSLGIFDGTNPNGTWQLFVRDEFGPDQGILSGWSLEITTPPVFCKGRAATLVGTEGDDVIVGGDGENVVVGLGGNDIIKTGNNNDTICAGDGNDRVRAGNSAKGGVDLVLGEGGKDKLFGQGGRDRLQGGGGKDLIKAGSGKDRLAGQQSNDKLRGQGGADKMNGGPGRDLCNGGGGKDTAAKCERVQLVP
jgi:subtilisin-like proprotein convertase family protein